MLPMIYVIWRTLHLFIWYVWRVVCMMYMTCGVYDDIYICHIYHTHHTSYTSYTPHLIYIIHTTPHIYHIQHTSYTSYTPHVIYIIYTIIYTAASYTYIHYVIYIIYTTAYKACIDSRETEFLLELFFDAFPDCRVIS